MAPGIRAGRFFFESPMRLGGARFATPAGVVIFALLAASCGGKAREAPDATAPALPSPSKAEPFLFVDAAREAGLTRVLLAGRPGKDHLLDSAGAGVAWLDFDRDGFLDAYLVNGWKLSGDQVVEKGRNALYRNRGDGTFEDVTETSRTGGEGRWGGGVTVADYDNDGYPDIFLTNFGPSVLYRNRGDRTFENVAARAGVESPGWNTGAVFFDADADGDLDLYVASYIDCSLEEVLKAKPSLDWKGVDKVALGPFGLTGAADHFFLSDGQGRFREMTTPAGLEDRALAYGFGVRAADFDADGDADLYVANDSDPNYLYRNEGEGKFREVGLWSGAALNANAAAQAGMGIAVGDAQGDGFLDIFVTNFAEDYSTLYRGDGKGFFEDASEEAGVAQPTFKPLSWGTTFADLDCDGDEDLVVANGHIYPQVDRHPEFDNAYAQKSLLLENTGKGKFIDATGKAGPGFSSARVSRGLSAGDYDNDGDLDLLISNLDAPPTLLRNDTPRRGSCLSVSLEVPPGHGTTIGTVVTVEAGGRKLIRELSSSDSYLSAPDPRLHFGLGDSKKVDRLEVRWPDGTRQVLTDVAADQFLTLRKPQ
jgi:enediyne biosynthesis protein E4